MEKDNNQLKEQARKLSNICSLLLKENKNQRKYIQKKNQDFKNFAVILGETETENINLLKKENDLLIKEL